jgi:formamidopyrimidine-DNA glycosylase
MPELPEVETVVNAIKKSLKSMTINRFIIMNNKLRWKIDSDISNSVKDQKIKLIYRRGKHIIFRLDNGYLLIHLGMTGIVKFIDGLDLKGMEKHDHYEIQLKDNKILRYNDIRKFGSIHWTQDIDNHFLIKNLGPEPLSEEFNGVFLKNKCRKRNVAIKNLIMNQRIVVGVGNIYACESLYLSSIRPEKKCKYITLKQCNDLAKAMF